MRTAAAERRSSPASRALARRSRRIAAALRLRAAKSFACDAGEDSSAERWRGRSPTQTVPPAVVGEADEGRELVPPASGSPAEPRAGGTRERLVIRAGDEGGRP